MNMKVVFTDNKNGEIDSALLSEMIGSDKIRMFKRSDGWATVGISHLRGDGGDYEGVERRGVYGIEGGMRYKIVA